jgi:hypothetical protein
VHINYLTKDNEPYRLLKKSVSIDGLPILVDEKHDPVTDTNVVLQAPLAEGKHHLNVVLLFGESKWVKGGPLYNFRLTFDRDFQMVSGQDTYVDVEAKLRDGFIPSEPDSRYARVTTSIRSKEYADVFSDLTCKEQRDKQAAIEQKKLREDAKKTESVKQPIEETKPEKAPVQEAAPQAPTEKSPDVQENVPPVKAPENAPSAPNEGTLPQGPEELPLLPPPMERPGDEPLPPIISPNRQPQSSLHKGEDAKSVMNQTIKSEQSLAAFASMGG